MSGVSDSSSNTHAAIELTTGMDCVINEPNQASTCPCDHASSTWPIAPAPRASDQIHNQSTACDRRRQPLPETSATTVISIAAIRTTCAMYSKAPTVARAFFEKSQ